VTKKLVTTYLVLVLFGPPRFDTFPPKDTTHAEQLISKDAGVLSGVNRDGGEKKPMLIPRRKLSVDNTNEVKKGIIGGSASM
jgi:hypothetical protein